MERRKWEGGKQEDECRVVGVLGAGAGVRREGHRGKEVFQFQMCLHLPCHKCLSHPSLSIVPVCLSVFLFEGNKEGRAVVCHVMDCRGNKH